MPTLINLTAFMLFWLLLVWSAFYGWDLAASTALVCWLGVHLSYSRHLRADLRIILAAIIIGPICDTLMIHLKLADYVGFRLSPLMPPFWVYAMWANFAQLLNHSLRNMRGRWLLIVLTAVTAAPASYWLGSVLGTVEIYQPKWLSLLVVAVCWGLILPLLMRLSSLGVPLAITKR